MNINFENMTVSCKTSIVSTDSLSSADLEFLLRYAKIFTTVKKSMWIMSITDMPIRVVGLAQAGFDEKHPTGYFDFELPEKSRIRIDV